MPHIYFESKKLSVMPGLVPGIHVLATNSWMAGTSPAMTGGLKRRHSRETLNVGRANLLVAAAAPDMALTVSSLRLS
jgi:hypothetical protein